MASVNAYDPEVAGKVLHPDYEQHNPFIPNGAEGLVGLFPAMKEAQGKVETVLLLENSDHVVAFNKWHKARIFGHGCNKMAAFDFFGVNPDGSLAAHWDAMMCERAPNASGRTLTDDVAEPKNLEKSPR